MLSPWQVKAYEAKAKEIGYVFIDFRSYDNALMWDVFAEMAVTLFLALIIVWVLYIKFYANPTAISISYLIEIVAMIIVLRGWLTMMKNSNPHKNCWWKPGKD